MPQEVQQELKDKQKVQYFAYQLPFSFQDLAKEIYFKPLPSTEHIGYDFFRGNIPHFKKF